MPTRDRVGILISADSAPKMVFSFLDDRGLITCVIADKGPEITVRTTDRAAPSGLFDAVESAGKFGLGECYWREQAGEYRWIFRREDDLLRIVLLRSSGTLTGWEHVFWSECDFALFRMQLRGELDRLP